MPNITIYVPDEVFNRYKSDKNKKGLIVSWLAEYYGFKVNKSRVVINTTAVKTKEPMPHLAAPLIQQFKAKDEA